MATHIADTAGHRQKSCWWQKKTQCMYTNSKCVLGSRLDFG